MKEVRKTSAIESTWQWHCERTEGVDTLIDAIATWAVTGCEHRAQSKHLYNYLNILRFQAVETENSENSLKMGVQYRSASSASSASASAPHQS